MSPCPNILCYRVQFCFIASFHRRRNWLNILLLFCITPMFIDKAFPSKNRMQRAWRKLASHFSKWDHVTGDNLPSRALPHTMVTLNHLPKRQTLVLLSSRHFKLSPSRLPRNYIRNVCNQPGCYLLRDVTIRISRLCEVNYGMWKL